MHFLVQLPLKACVIVILREESFRILLFLFRKKTEAWRHGEAVMQLLQNRFICFCRRRKDVWLVLNSWTRGDLWFSSISQWSYGQTASGRCQGIGGGIWGEAWKREWRGGRRRRDKEGCMIHYVNIRSCAFLEIKSACAPSFPTVTSLPNRFSLGGARFIKKSRSVQQQP